MNYKTLVENIKKKQSLLCVGLDTDIEQIPQFFKNYKDPIFEFNRQIIDRTSKYSIAYKINTAFYEQYGELGWNSMKKSLEHIKNNYPDIFVIADAKRGDISTSSEKYAKAFFENLNFDAITLSPYMGYDSIEPFFRYKNKFIILLALTSNTGSEDFQMLRINKNETLFETVIKKSKTWGSHENLMYVVGATKASMLVKVREIVPEHFLLIPGVKTQGGKIEEVFKYGCNKAGGLIINSSRYILYADNSENFANFSELKAKELQEEMSTLLKDFEIL